jgi:hypothetical protein
VEVIEQMEKFRLSLKVGGFGTLHFTADSEDALKKQLGNLRNLRDSILSAFSDSMMAQEVSGEFPHIGHPSSMSDAILKVLDTEWGKRQPRKECELHEALTINAIHTDKKTLCALLTYLTRQNKIKRIKIEGVYAYTLPLRSN